MSGNFDINGRYNTLCNVLYFFLYGDIIMLLTLSIYLYASRSARRCSWNFRNTGIKNVVQFLSAA